MFLFTNGVLRNYPGNFNNNWFAQFMLSFLATLGVYVATWDNLDRVADQMISLNNYPGDTFDFIVVGAGSSGAVVANRLSEKYSVLLLEYGGEPNPFQGIPGFANFLLNHPEIDWMHRTTPQKHSSYAMNNRQSFWNQGKGLGGTSNINYMQESRGNPRDFDNWANITGDDSWKYENLLPFFKKHEDFMGLWAPGDVHGRGGEMHIEVPPYIGMAPYFIRAGVEMGYLHDDLNGRYSEGFDFVYSPIKNGRRQSTHTTFIHSAIHRPNLIISKFSHVNKIHFRGEKNEAFAVEYDRHGYRRLAYANKEIILSAGALKSPQILMLSGIGPKNKLENIGIEVKKDASVGRNLQDHACTYLGPFFINETISLKLVRDTHLDTILQYMQQGTGILTNPGPNAQAFIGSSKAIAEAKLREDLVWPDIQLYFSDLSFEKESPKYLSAIFNIRQDIAEKYYLHSFERDSFLIVVSNARPKARGEITLLSSNPYDPPLLEPNYLDNDNDIQVTIEGVKKAIELAENTKTFQSVGTRFTDEVFPGCENVTFRSDDYWECYIRHYTVSLHHFTGTCAMGKVDSPYSVVDSQLKVIGTKRLRVIDASIMPVIPVGNTNAPAMVIGEKGAHMILNEWQNENSEADNIINTIPTSTSGSPSPTTEVKDGNNNIPDYPDYGWPVVNVPPA